MKHSLDFLDTKGKRAFARTFINYKANHLHEINDIIICSYLDVFITVNKTTLVFNYWDSEQEALNNVLDFYGSTKTDQKQLDFIRDKPIIDR